MQHWDSYWQKTKALNSFAEGEQAQGYTGDIAQFWQDIIRSLPDTAAVLDLATGNGGLAVLALQLRDDLQLSASDRANIAPLALFDARDAVYPLLQKIQFYGNMASEQLTFADQTFDIVISQFGFEYAAAEPTLEQLHRVVKPGGKFTALVHHRDSFITRDCQAGLVAIQCFIAEQGLFSEALPFARLCQELQRETILSADQQASLKQHSSALLYSFKQQQDSLQAEQKEWFNLLAADIVPVIANWRSLTSDAIAQLRANMLSFNQRLLDQVNAAWDSDDASKIQQLCALKWHDVSVSTLDTTEGKLCWVLQAHK